MNHGLDTKDKAYYNLRKRYGEDVAKIIINFGIIFTSILRELPTRH